MALWHCARRPVPDGASKGSWLLQKTESCTLYDISGQEAQLSQRDRASLRVNGYFAKSLKVIPNDTIEYRACKSLLVFHWNYVCRTVSEILSVKEWRDLETGGRGRSRSFKMAPFDRLLYDFLLVGHCKYSCTLYHFHVIWRWIIVTLQGHWRSFKLEPFESLGAVSYSPSIVTMAVSLTVYEIFSVKV